MCKHRAFAAFFIASLFQPAITWANPTPSFDCAKASTFAEVSICADDELAQLDVRLSKAYKAHLSASSDTAAAKAAQRAWVSQREACGSADCIEILYVDRITELGGGVSTVAASDPTEQAGNYVVANTSPPDNYLSLRTAPSVSAGSRLTKMQNGTELQVLERTSGGWTRVRVVETGQIGWAFAGTENKRYIVWKPAVASAAANAEPILEQTGTYVVANGAQPEDYLALRSQPSVTSGDQVAKMANGTALEVLQRTNGGWIRVRVVATGQEGWAFSGTDQTRYIVWKSNEAIAAETAAIEAKALSDAKVVALAKAERAAAERAKEEAEKTHAIAEISVALGSPDPDDLFVFQNQGGNAPNLAKNLDGELVSATGALSVCHTDITSPYAGERGERYRQSVVDFLATALPSGAEPSSVDLEQCGSQTPADALYFQLGQLEAAPLKFVKYLSENLNVSFTETAVFSRQDAENAEASFVAAQQKALADKAALKKNTLENIRSGTEDGIGFLVVTGEKAPLCYFSGGELSAVIADNTEPVLHKIFAATAIAEEVNKLNTSLKPINSLDEIYIGITRKPPSCGWMFGDRTSLQKVASAMERDGIAFDTMPYWATAEEIAPLVEAARIDQQANAEAKAAQDAAAAQAAEQKTAEDEVAAETQKEAASSTTTEAEAKFRDGSHQGYTFLQIDNGANSVCINVSGENEIDDFTAQNLSNAVILIAIQNMDIINAIKMNENTTFATFRSAKSFKEKLKSIATTCSAVFLDYASIGDLADNLRNAGAKLNFTNIEISDEKFNEYLNKEIAKESNQASTQAADSTIENNSNGELSTEQGFDETGLVDLRNKGTTVGSCYYLAVALPNATFNIKKQLVRDAYKSSDAELGAALGKANKLAGELDSYGSIGNTYADDWGNNHVLMMPENEKGDFSVAIKDTQIRVNMVMEAEPEKIMKAFEYCRAILR